jgi:hypothetical protein
MMFFSKHVCLLVHHTSPWSFNTLNHFSTSVLCSYRMNVFVMCLIEESTTVRNLFVKKCIFEVNPGVKGF